MSRDRKRGVGHWPQATAPISDSTGPLSEWRPLFKLATHVSLLRCALNGAGQGRQYKGTIGLNSRQLFPEHTGKSPPVVSALMDAANADVESSVVLAARSQF
jgi:hypothetical protein